MTTFEPVVIPCAVDPHELLRLDLRASGLQVAVLTLPEGAEPPNVVLERDGIRKLIGHLVDAYATLTALGAVRDQNFPLAGTASDRCPRCGGFIWTRRHIDTCVPQHQESRKDQQP